MPIPREHLNGSTFSTCIPKFHKKQKWNSSSRQKSVWSFEDNASSFFQDHLDRWRSIIILLCAKLHLFYSAISCCCVSCLACTRFANKHLRVLKVNLYYCRWRLYMRANWQCREYICVGGGCSSSMVLLIWILSWTNMLSSGSQYTPTYVLFSVVSQSTHVRIMHAISQIRL